MDQRSLALAAIGGDRYRHLAVGRDSVRLALLSVLGGRWHVKWHGASAAARYFETPPSGFRPARKPRVQSPGPGDRKVWGTLGGGIGAAEWQDVSSSNILLSGHASSEIFKFRVPCDRATSFCNLPLKKARQCDYWLSLRRPTEYDVFLCPPPRVQCSGKTCRLRI
ncbi:hypothetical protein VTO73DRAFT_11314 [Trametes versicolor]